MDAAHRFRYLLEFAAFRAALAALGALPDALGRWVGGIFGRTAGVLVRSRSRRAAENLRAAFPDASEARIKAWVDGMWRNLGQVIREFSIQPSLTAETYFQRVEVTGLEEVRASFAKGKGIIFYTAHMVNWEYLSLFLAFSGFPMAVVARRMKNPYFDAFITHVRSCHGLTLFHHRSAVRDGLRWVKQGNCLGLLVDQRITAGGVQVPFFGRPAFTTTMPALLALRSGAALHGVSARREGKKIRIRVHPALDPASFDNDSRAITAAQTAQIESWIREDPSCWLWMHNRWKI